MKELVEKIVRALVDSPEDVDVQETEGITMTLVQIRVSKNDVGKLIGRKGKNISALRTIVAGAGKGRRYMVEVVGENRYPPGNSHLQKVGDQDDRRTPGREGDSQNG